MRVRERRKKRRGTGNAEEERIFKIRLSLKSRRGEKEGMRKILHREKYCENAEKMTP